MPPFNDLVGIQFGRLTPIARIHGARVNWLCECVCGRSVKVTAERLRSGKTRSCGCLRIEMTAGRNRTHGRCGTAEHRTWKHAKGRCYNPSNAKYRDYGGRGIVMCDRWRESFPAFLADMGLRPSAKHCIERIDNDGPYSPENCRWATYAEQMRNTRRTHFVSLSGHRYTLTDAACLLGVSRSTLDKRLRRAVLHAN